MVALVVKREVLEVIDGGGRSPLFIQGSEDIGEFIILLLEPYVEVSIELVLVNVFSDELRFGCLVNFGDIGPHIMIASQGDPRYIKILKDTYSGVELRYFRTVRDITAHDHELYVIVLMVLVN